MKRGFFITLEGPEGSGKSTHSRLLFKFLKRRGLAILHLREPGGTKIGERIRDILLDLANKGMSDYCELLLFEAARAELVKEKILPFLAEKKIIICDRFSDATLAYQGCGGGIDLRAIKRVQKISCGNLKPDLTILLDIPTKEGLRRSAKKRRVDRMERKSFAYHVRVRRGYLKLAKAEPRRIKIIPVQKSINDTRRLIKEVVVKGLIKRRIMKNVENRSVKT